MFDDFLNGAMLLGVSTTLAVAVAASLATSTASAPRSPTTGAVAASAQAAPAARPAAAAAAAASMPVYELPRVVITGNRLREGDVLADNAVASPWPVGRR